MTDKQMRKTVRSFINNNDIKELSFAELKRVLKQQGFTLVRYSHRGNTPEVDTILASLNLSKYALSVKAFTYVDGSNRLIFLVENLSDREAVILLAHEEGHIVLDCVGNGKVFGDDIENEYAANEFAHHLIKRFQNKPLSQIQQRKKPLIVFISVLAVLVVGMLAFTFFNGRSTGEDIYYVTSTGKKYHAKDCKYIEGKDDLKALTREECIRQGYEPCSVCIKNHTNQDNTESTPSTTVEDTTIIVEATTDVNKTSPTTTETKTVAEKKVTVFAEAKSSAKGTVKGNVTWQYNDYIGTKPDVDSVVYLLPDNIRKDQLTDEHALGMRTADMPEGSFKTQVDGMGEYCITNVPTGKYIIWIFSKNTSPSPKLANIYFDYMSSYFNEDLWDYLRTTLKAYNLAFDEITVSEGDNVFSYDFGNTYY